MQARAVIYTRISVAALGDTTKTDDQERLGRAMCERRGWEVVAVYTDNGESAWKRNRKRPGWDRMLADLEDGKAEVIYAYWGDRLVRQNRDLEDLLDLGRDRGIVLAGEGGEYDLANSDHRMMLRWITARSCNESDTISRRKTEQYKRWRKEGRVRVGGYRAFGFARDGIAHDAAEVALIRELASRVLAGESLGSLVRDLNERELLTTAGNPWSHITLRNMLTRPRYAGLMPDGKSPAGWEPVLERGEWERLRAVIGTRSAGDRPPGVSPDNTRKYLLSGTAECGACGARLSIHQSRHGNGRAAKRYSCKACRKVARSQPLLDAYVTGRVLARLGHAQNPLPAVADARMGAELDLLTRRRAETVAVIESLADHPGESPLALARALDSFDARIRQLRDQAATGENERLRAAHAGITLEQFNSLDLGAQRSIVAACYRIIVKPASRKGPGFDPADILMSPL